MAVPNIYLEVDVSELSGEINRLRGVMKPMQFEQAMYGIFQRTGSHVRQILKEDLPVDYCVKPGQISRAVKGAQMTSGAGGLGCTIPVQDVRGSIGGRFSAYGGADGWNSLRRKYRVTAAIVKAGRSTLPANMSSYGGQPPFRNLGSKLGGITFTRAGKARLPIELVSGIAIPQMPMNRSQGAVQGDIMDFMQTQIEHRFQSIIGGGH